MLDPGVASMSRTVRMTTSLPSSPGARIWVNLDYIVVSISGQTCCAHRPWMTREQLSELALVLTEAANMDG